LEKIPVPLFVINQQQEIMFLNSRSQRMTDYKIQDVYVVDGQ
jgi:hypothetical protein